jgi:hypothetical protein
MNVGCQNGVAELRIAANCGNFGINKMGVRGKDLAGGLPPGPPLRGGLTPPHPPQGIGARRGSELIEWGSELGDFALLGSGNSVWQRDRAIALPGQEEH